MPEAVIPAADVRADAPPAPGMGRVVFDVAGGAGFVDEVRYRTRTFDQDPSGVLVPFHSVGAESTLPLCKTPCVMDLTLGSHEIAFARLDTGARDTDIIAVGPEVTVVRHAVGYRRPYRSGLLLGGVLLATFGAIGLTVGSGLAIAPTGATPDEVDQHRMNGIITAAASLGVTALGALMILLAPERDEPGPTRQWALQGSR